jgi:D-arabinose 1-dehydrogenase-like Zn-dependent alcohol dehydrogenase
MTGTYAGADRVTGEHTHGGYSKHLVVREEFCLRVPEAWTLRRRRRCCAPASRLFAAAYLERWPGKPRRRDWPGRPSGHMAVKLAVGMGADVTVLSRTRDKEADALELGADRLLVSRMRAAMASAANTFDLIIDTVPVKHDLDPYLPLLDIDGTLVIVGQIGSDAGNEHRAAAAWPPPRRRLADRRHPRDPRDARLLCREEHLARMRDDPHGPDQRGLRAHGALRRALPLRDRHGLAGGAR